jgi:hypothetical protein
MSLEFAQNLRMKTRHATEAVKRVRREMIHGLPVQFTNPFFNIHPIQPTIKDNTFKNTSI